MKVRVVVTLKAPVLDPQGKAIEKAASKMSLSLQSVRVGKVFDIEISSTTHEAGMAEIRKLSEKLLSNPVIENVEYEVTG